MFSTLFCVTVLLAIVLAGHPHSLVWNGGPLHLECEHSAFLTHTGQYVRENVIVIKALTFKDKIYVISPRWRRGILATVWLIIRGRHGVELEAFPDQNVHSVANCRAIQNAVDFHLDHLQAIRLIGDEALLTAKMFKIKNIDEGNLWILDSGVVETMERPRCTCPPKVIVISIPKRKVTKHIALTSLEPTSLLQNIVVENGIGKKQFVYISDASRGAIIVHDTSSDDQWAVLACAPAGGLQLALIKRGLSHTVLMVNRLNHKGLLELDTAALKRNSHSTIRVFGEQSKPIILLGTDSHHMYLRHVGCADVLVWDTRDIYNSSYLQNMHSAGPGLTPTSVTTDLDNHVRLVLESNYVDTVNSNTETFHRISFIDRW